MEINNKKRNLIILRCGKNSLHKKWININANFDLFLLPYENFIAKTEKNCTLFPLMPGQKWPAISKFIKENIDLVSNYDFIMMPDDDLLITALKLNKLFNQLSIDKPALSQPSLSYKSYYSHFITLKFPGLYARETSFVEIMTPIFHIEALTSLLWTFSLNSSGWGLEPLWFKVINSTNFSKCKSKLIIYDNISLTHTRKVGGQNRGIGIKDKDPDFERNQLLKKWNLRLIFKIYSVKINSKIIENKIWVRETDPEFSDIIFKAYTSFKYIMKKEKFLYSSPRHVKFEFNKLISPKTKINLLLKKLNILSK